MRKVLKIKVGGMGDLKFFSLFVSVSCLTSHFTRLHWITHNFYWTALEHITMYLKYNLYPKWRKQIKSPMKWEYTGYLFNASLVTKEELTKTSGSSSKTLAWRSFTWFARSFGKRCSGISLAYGLARIFWFSMFFCLKCKMLRSSPLAVFFLQNSAVEASWHLLEKMAQKRGADSSVC